MPLKSKANSNIAQKGSHQHAMICRTRVKDQKVGLVESGIGGGAPSSPGVMTGEALAELLPPPRPGLFFGGGGGGFFLLASPAKGDGAGGVSCWALLLLAPNL
jgi:hypothetical protein